MFLPGEANDARGFKALPFNLPSDSMVYCDAGYTDYWAEDEFQENEAISLQVMGNVILEDQTLLVWHISNNINDI